MVAGLIKWFLGALIGAGFDWLAELIAEEKKSAALEAKGARDQRDAQRAADAAAAEEMRERDDELSQVSDDDLARRADRWLRQ